MAEKKVSAEKKVVATAGIYDILRRPIISEKAAKLSENNSVAFEVACDATKEDVARAVEAIFNVKPTKVNIVVSNQITIRIKTSRLHINPRIASSINTLTNRNIDIIFTRIIKLGYTKTVKCNH